MTGNERPPQPRRSFIDHAAEQEALECIRRGRPEEALKLLMRAYGGPITAFAQRMLHHSEAAKDVRQQVFLDALRGVGKFEGRSSLWSWLCGIAYHRCLDERRRMLRTDDVDGFDGSDRFFGQPDPMMDADRIAGQRALERCLGKLPEAMRAQVLMRYLLDLSYVEIGEIVGSSHGTVQVRIARILPRLRRCLRGEGVGR